MIQEKNIDIIKDDLYIDDRHMTYSFLTLSEEVDNLYNKELDGGIRYDDPTTNIDWKQLFNSIEPILSVKDKNAPSKKGCKASFIYYE